MKITKGKLQQIIREELTRVLNEALGDGELSENTGRWHQYKRKFISPDFFQHLFCSPVCEARRTGYISGPGFKAVWNIGRINTL